MTVLARRHHLQIGADHAGSAARADAGDHVAGSRAGRLGESAFIGAGLNLSVRDHGGAFGIADRDIGGLALQIGQSGVRGAGAGRLGAAAPAIASAPRRARLKRPATAGLGRNIGRPIASVENERASSSNPRAKV